ncbi:MAG: hypothetical protein HQ567_27545 [Candidatus Nealsonbacteria bacterium]|nr:hypothetical protein [Candidatus Nealsonbacteria bacterium]
MGTELRWVVNQSANSFYTADLIRRGIDLPDSELVAALREPTAKLSATVDTNGLPVELFWRHLVPLSATIGSNRDLAKTVSRKLIGSNPRVEFLVDRLAGRISDIEAAANRAMPQLCEQVASLGGRLQQEWARHGRVILSTVAQQTDQQLIVSQADVMPVFPSGGGGGTSHLLYNSVSIEAVDDDPVAEVPEVLRLAWLVVQLNVDLPMFSENLQPGRRPLIAAASMIPPVLVAAEGAELARYDLPSVAAAIAAWRIEGPPGVDLAEVITLWWSTYTEARLRWNVALTALDRMIV